jgi:hypothetical protein
MCVWSHPILEEGRPRNQAACFINMHCFGLYLYYTNVLIACWYNREHISLLILNYTT